MGIGVHSMEITNMIKDIQNTYGRKIARAAFELSAIKLEIENPFQWASGYRMPIYNDNRQFLRSSTARTLIAQAFKELMVGFELSPSRIAGTATAGIPHATTLADLMDLPLLYVRGAQKKHGMQNAVEGLESDSNRNVDEEEILLIEDLISTGGSSIRAVETLTQIGFQVPWCFSIFSYGLSAADEAFLSLKPECRYATLLSYDIMVEEALTSGYIEGDDAEDLREWRESPMTWGEKRGFPRVNQE
jgi:orotate phosphoribosyltransferase